MALEARLGTVRVDGAAQAVIHAPKPEPRIMRYELSDYEWTAIKPMLPNKPRGVRRVNDRRVLNGIFWVLRSGAPWRDLPAAYGPRTTCYNRFVRWRQAGVWDQIMDALAAGHDTAVQMIDTSVVHVHQHGACISDNNHQDRCAVRGRSATSRAARDRRCGCHGRISARRATGPCLLVAHSGHCDEAA